MLRFHYTYILLALGYVLTGYYINLLVVTSLIIVHEFGHFIVLKLFNFKVLEIVIYPFGGVTKVNDLINKDINKELLVATAGIIWQFMFYILIMIGNRLGVVRDYTFSLYTLYNSQIIFFNMLPICPLDGFKIVNLLMSKVVNYNCANIVTGVVSFLVCCLFIIFNSYNHNYSYFMIISIVFIYNYKFFKEIKYIYNKFLLERYLYNIKYSKIKVINDGKKMFKNYNHVIKVGDKYVNEKKYLAKYYFK